MQTCNEVGAISGAASRGSGCRSADADGDPNPKRVRFYSDDDSKASVDQPLETDGVHDVVLDAVRDALQAQAAKLSGVFDTQVQEMTLSWEARLQRLAANMDAERADTQRKMTMLIDFKSSKMQAKG